MVILIDLLYLHIIMRSYYGKENNIYTYGIQCRLVKKTI